MKTPIYRVNSSAQISLVEHIDAVPWWLFDRLPQGFAGRVYASQILKKHPEFSSDLRDWSDPVVLQLLSEYPVDAIGNLLIGDKDLKRYLVSENQPCPLADLPQLAEHAKEFCQMLISGEQPKFCCDIEQLGPCIVKFAETVHQADLLIAEHTALSILNDAGIPSVQTTLFRSGHYQFLVIRRFDCISSGRRGVVSLKALDLEFVGSKEQRWPVIASQLIDQGVIAASALPTIQLLFCFGRLIANSDMHSGNLSFLDDGQMPFALAPAYDQLPMAYASDKQHISQITVDTDLPSSVWAHALPLALRFWQELAQQPLLSESFQIIAVQMLHSVQHAVAEQVGSV
jgi:hypothetical protein